MRYTLGSLRRPLATRGPALLVLLLAALFCVVPLNGPAAPVAAPAALDDTGGPTGEIYAEIADGATAPFLTAWAIGLQQPAALPHATAALAPAAIGTGRFSWPLSGRITQYFSKRHDGIDIARARGSAIRAADRGEVIFAGWSTDGLGYAVRINHHDGYVTVYGHMMKKPSVHVGQLVAKGQTIGYVGSTGRSTGPHLHFIIRTPTMHYYNPLRFLN
jgi:murein DD-endopeptidase MepM/ murein hydrolase activator NlpD